MKCSNCNKEIKNELGMKLLNSDGDFACNEKCKKEYNSKKDKFFNEIVHNEKKTINYLKGN